MSDGEAAASDGATGLRGRWAGAKPARHDYAAVVTELNASKLVGEGSVFERGPHVPITHLGYFKPPVDAFLSELKSKDRRSAKEWEYINGAGVWIETGLAAMTLAKEQEGTVEDLARRLALAEKAFKAALEVISMRAQYFRDVVENGVEEARQMAYLVEQGHDAVHSESYRTAREALTSKIELEAAKQLAKARISKAGGKKKGGGQGAADSE